MASDPYRHFGVPTIINCVGFATRVGGSCPDWPILDAMRDANRGYVEIDDLQAAASRVIARHTGAEAGIVTCGAAAGLTLAAAACLVGSNVEWMDQLPDTAHFPRNEIIYPEAGPYDYDHPLRTAGARLVSVDYQAADALKRIEAAIGPRTAAIGYAWLQANESPRLDALIELAHRHGLPVIIDGAMALPPAENLTRFVRLGADLVVISGGKHLGGPQASGILCGKEHLVRSAWVQMVDMDVRPGSWSLRRWIDEGWIERPPRHGIGRSMKVGKESIIGLLCALEAYVQRDFQAEQDRWRSLAEGIAAGITAIGAYSVGLRFPSPTGQPYPTVQVEVRAGALDIDMRGVQNALRDHRPKIILAEDETDTNRAYIYPMCLHVDDVDRIIAAFTHVAARRQSS
jgi:D-glucosaminate-6-phosphate ammonia-lyase